MGNILLEELEKAENHCRVHCDRSFHVGYATTESKLTVCTDETETRNLTHQAVVEQDFDERNESECSWVCSVENGVQLIVSLDGEDIAVHQSLSAQTALQLSNMFLHAAQILLLKQEATRLEAERVQAIIDSQKLPFPVSE